MDDFSQLIIVHRLRYATCALSLGEFNHGVLVISIDRNLGVLAVGIFAILITHFRFGLDSRRTGFLLIPTAFLSIVQIYRLIQSLTYNPSAAVRSNSAFFVLQISFELYVEIPY